MFGPSLGIVLVRGIGLIHTELVSGIQAIFSHFVTNLPAFHQVLVFLCVKSVPIPHEEMIVGGLPSTHPHGIRLCEEDGVNPDVLGTSQVREIQSQPAMKTSKKVWFVIPESPKMDRGAREELRELMDAREAGIAYIMGHSYVKAKLGSSLIKKVMINSGYDFFEKKL